MKVYGDNRLRFELNGFELELQMLCFKDSQWRVMDIVEQKDGFRCKSDGIRSHLAFKPGGEELRYKLRMDSDFTTRVKLRVKLIHQEDLFHIIPCNIHGDNNLAKAEPGHYPNLTKNDPEYVFSSDIWEFRADRASHPVSILCCNKGSVGISIEPYSESSEREEGFIRNGVFSQLEDYFGVALGYGNDPVTFLDKDNAQEPTCHLVKSAEAKGAIYGFMGKGRYETHKIIRRMYERYRSKPTHEKSFAEATEALANSFMYVNWSEKMESFTNQHCVVPYSPKLRPWRPLLEIGWTGGGVIAYPLLVAEQVMGKKWSDTEAPTDPRDIFDAIIKSYNPASGLFFDLMREWDGPHGPSRVNGWWTGYPLTKDCHCSYTNASALYYLFKSIDFMNNYTNDSFPEWVETGCKVLDTVLKLQADDGNYGYTYSISEPKVIDWEGFSGCWFAGAMVYAYKLTGKQEYLESAKKAMDFYSKDVYELNCWGAPMDTWKSVDQEGNLAFMRTARVLHEITGEDRYLEYLEAAANYEYLWRYSFKARPEFKPLKDSGWNSCGGSVTSVSNPHLHPMGVFVAGDLEYLAEQTGDDYHQKRADDSLAWAMNCMELYPKVTGYGQYGVLTERYCPSDGLTIDRMFTKEEGSKAIVEHENGHIDKKEGYGTPASMWFSYNGWAAAAAMEGIAEKALREKSE